MTRWRTETIGDATLICGDCREILPTLPRVDAVVTDPPYGIGFEGKSGHYRNKRNFKRQGSYASFDDTPENFEQLILPALRDALALSDCGLVFMASETLQRLPHGEVGGIFLPSPTSSGSWGFKSFIHCVFYGADPMLKAGLGRRPTGKYGLYGNDANTIDHPCAKPIAAMLWAVARVSLGGSVILDPFMGSGTTGVAALKLGRKFIGIEIEPKYFDIACRRIAEAHAQPRLFEEPRRKAKQGELEL